MLEQIPRVPMALHYNRMGSGTEPYHQQMRLNNYSLPGVGVNTIGSDGTVDCGNRLVTPAISQFTPVPKSPYSVREPVLGPGHQFDPQHRQEYQYIHDWNQSAGYEYHGPPIQNQSPQRPPFYHDYQQDHFNIDPHQQINHNMRQLYADGDVHPQFHQEGRNSDYYNRFHSNPGNNVTYSQHQSNISSYPNEQYSRTSAHQESSGAHWSSEPISKDTDDLQDRPPGVFAVDL